MRNETTLPASEDACTSSDQQCDDDLGPLVDQDLGDRGGDGCSDDSAEPFLVGGRDRPGEGGGPSRFRYDGSFEDVGGGGGGGSMWWGGGGGNSRRRNQALLLAMSLSTTLLAFWLLDSLKDPVFAALSGDLRRYQPIAKMVSVASTLLLVCGMEVVGYERRRRRRGRRTMRGAASSDSDSDSTAEGGGASVSLFWQVGIPYCLVFCVIGSCLAYHPDLGRLRRRGGVVVAAPTSRAAGGGGTSAPAVPAGAIAAATAAVTERLDDEASDLFAADYWSTSSSTVSDPDRHDEPIVVAATTPESSRPPPTRDSTGAAAAVAATAAARNAATAWRALGYATYVSIESFGSISVAAFWSFANSSLDLASAERHYGLIIAVAQVGAIAGATIATRVADGGGGGGEARGGGGGSIPPLFFVSALVIVANMILMRFYGRLYPSTRAASSSSSSMEWRVEMGRMSQSRDKFVHGETKAMEIGTSSSTPATSVPSSFSPPSRYASPARYRTTKGGRGGGGGGGSGAFQASGVYLILKHNYILLILGVSCLYEIALTCLDYEMKLVGLAKFEAWNDVATASTSTSTTTSVEEGFASFMGRYGQLTNLLSLGLSYFGFPLMMRKVGLRLTLRVFPAVLLCVTILIFFVLPRPDLMVLFVALALLKAMTYSVNDPAKEILYMPTSRSVKFRAKFWIDVVGARCAKALGSAVTNYAGSTDRIVRYGAVPSVATSLVLLMVSVRAGEEFDDLVESGEVVGSEEELRESEGGGGGAYGDYGYDDPSVQYQLVSSYDDDDDDDDYGPGRFVGLWEGTDGQYSGSRGGRGTDGGVQTIGGSYCDGESSITSDSWESNTSIELVPVRQ